MMPVAAEVIRVHVGTKIGTLALEARYAAGSAAGAVVAPPHPLYGGTFDNPAVVATLAGLHRASVATVTFNYRGVEQSEGQATDSLEDAVSDYSAALEELRARTPGPYFAAGYSFGAGAALLTARHDPRVKGVVLVAPPVGMLRAEDLRTLAGALFVVVGDNDEYAPVEQLTALLSSRPDAKLSVIAGADHFFHFGGLQQIAQQVTAEVRSWL